MCQTSQSNILLEKIKLFCLTEFSLKALYFSLFQAICVISNSAYSVDTEPLFFAYKILHLEKIIIQSK